MCEFKTSFSSILRGDLKHIYSGVPARPALRHSNPLPSQEQLRLQTASQDLKTSVPKASEFVPEYDCLIPRAPAFRVLSRHDVHSCVARLSQCSPADSTASSEAAVREEAARAHSKYLGLRTVGPREMTNIVNRVSKHTESTKIRDFQNKAKLPTVQSKN